MKRTAVTVLSEFSTTDGGQLIHGQPGQTVHLTDDGLERLKGLVVIPSEPKKKKKVEAAPVEAEAGETEELTNG